jgi:ABC-2 type transport system ATP-binding protein
MESVLEAKNLTKIYPEFRLDNVSLSVPKGSIKGVIGPNGAGKTTTIRILMNLIRADGGEVSLFGLAYPAKEERD